MPRNSTFRTSTFFINGSEFVDPLTIKNFAELFAVRPDAFAPGYGLAENVCLATVAHRDYRTVRIHADALRKNRFVPCEHGEGKEIVSLGKPVKGLTMVAVDPESGKPCEDGRIGEIYIQGDSVCQGYWGNVKDNENFRVRVEGLGGEFYKTGDLGIIYRGNFYMTGRIKELIVVNGHNVCRAISGLFYRKTYRPCLWDRLSFFLWKPTNRKRWLFAWRPTTSIWSLLPSPPGSIT